MIIALNSCFSGRGVHSRFIYNIVPLIFKISLLFVEVYEYISESKPVHLNFNRQE